MTDSKKRTQTLKLVKKIWELNPDLRFTQLIQNPFGSFDSYYVEDDHLIERLKKYYLSDDHPQSRKEK